MESSKPTRILCVNCNICVNTFRRYRVVDQTTRVCTLLCNWVHPQIITDNDYICEACFKLSVAAVNQNLQHSTSGDKQGSSRLRGHINVCFLCGCSTARKQTDKILRNNPTELQQSIVNLIQMKTEPRQPTPTDKVCHSCWWRIKREALRNNHVHEVRSPEVVCIKEEVISQDNESHENPQAKDIATPNIRATIILPDYRRAANSSNHCVFRNCTNTGKLHSISDQLRATILSNHKYYLPKLARVCSDHLSANSWDSLYESTNSINTFNVEQVQHIFTFVNAFNPTVDFENIQEIEERIFEFWVGFSKEQFHLLLAEVPKVLEIKGGRLGLVSLLIKMRTGDSNERIATLLQKPRRSLETLMNRVREVLACDLTPKLDCD